MAGSSPKQQAQQAAQGAVPTIGSINRQYGQSISDVENFTTALAKLLGGMPSAQGAYNTAIQQQGGIDNAAQAALRATGTPYAAGSGAAVAGLGSSALSNLNARGAAAGAYSATLPHVAAARGTLGVQTLESAKQNALQTRSDAYRQAYLSALAQARQNAEQMRQFGITTGLQRQQMAQQNAQFNANQAYQYAALRQNQNQFSQGQALQFQEFQAKLRASLQSGSAGPANWTPTQIRAAQHQAFTYISDPKNGVAEGGMKITQAINNLVQQGVPRQIAVYEANQGYANLTKPPKAGQGPFVSYDKSGNPVVTAQDRANARSALNAYNTAMRSFQNWVRKRLYHSTITNQQSQGTAPGQGRGVG